VTGGLLVFEIRRPPGRPLVTAYSLVFLMMTCVGFQLAFTSLSYIKCYADIQMRDCIFLQQINFYFNKHPEGKKFLYISIQGNI